MWLGPEVVFVDEKVGLETWDYFALWYNGTCQYPVNKSYLLSHNPTWLTSFDPTGLEIFCQDITEPSDVVRGLYKSM